MIMVLTAEPCEFDTENAWEGIEYEDGKEEKSQAKSRKGKHRRGSAARARNSKPVRGEGASVVGLSEDANGTGGSEKSLART